MTMDYETLKTANKFTTVPKTAIKIYWFLFPGKKVYL